MTHQRPAPAAAHRAHLNPARPHRVFPRLSDEEKNLVEKAAAAAGLTPAGFVAKAAIAASTNPGGPSLASGDLRDLQRELFAARRALNMLGSNVNQAAAAVNSGAGLPDWAVEAVRLCTAAVARVDAVTRRLDRRLR